MTTHTVFGAERNIEIPSSTFPNEVFPSEKEIKEMEDLMPGCEHGWFDSCYGNGVKLHYRKFMPTDNKPPKAVVVWMHGIAGHSGPAFEMEENGKKKPLNIALLSQEMRKQGIAFFAFDMYGHGFSEGTRFLIPKSWEVNKQDYINFCNLVVQEHVPDESVPLIISGESYGACLTIHVARHFQDYPEKDPAAKRFDSFFVNAPAIVADMPPAPVYLTLRYCLAPLFPNWIPFFMPNTVSADRIWRDPTVRALHVGCRYDEMGLEGNGRPFRLGTALNLVLALEEVRNTVIPGLSVPFCAIHGTSDYAVPIDGTDLLYEKSTTPEAEKCVHRIDGGYHDLLGDPLREQVVQHIFDWIKSRIEKRESKKGNRKHLQS